MARFEDLGLPKDALRAVRVLGYEEPTPVQEQAIPIILKGSDVIAAASTGTGKTAAFLLPSVGKLEHPKRGPRAPRILVITPTRELAEQIAYSSMKIARSCGQFAAVVYGGKPYGPQIRELRHGTDVLIATPGRLCDLIERGVADLGSVQTLILDEADRMLDMGFLPDVRKIVELCPKDRQTLLFSATIDEGIRRNFEELLTEPEIVQIAKRGETAKIADQFILPVAQNEKAELLKCLLDEKGYDKVIVFARTKSRAEGVCGMLKKAGYPVDCIHSDKSQGQRKRALSDFRKGNVNVLVATDVLSRGIDIPEVDYVVNYDLPDMAEDYIHRIGRTGRAGQEGFAVSFVSPNSMKSLSAIERLVQRQIPVMRIDSYDVDMSILKHGGRAKANGALRGAKRNSGKGRSLQPKYNYEGWGDLRNAPKKKDRKQSPEEKRVRRGEKKGDMRPGRAHRNEMRYGRKPEPAPESPRDKKARGAAAGKSRAPKMPRRRNRQK